MASDYAAIREANKAEYGNVGRWGRDVLVNRYDSGAHFIFELLQNAEDALRRRGDWSGSRAIRFRLTHTELSVAHTGAPFTMKDVKGVCGVAETTKDLTEIGRFGIGFKSVYSVTDRPEVHSGKEDFAIEQFVFPVAAPPVGRAADETQFVMPLRNSGEDAFSLVSDSLNKLGPRTLLFLREIEDIAWSVDGGSKGLYLRGKPEDAEGNSRSVALVGEGEGLPDIEEKWLIFSREAKTKEGKVAGFIEIGFLLREDEEAGSWDVHPLDASPLYAFFPTVLATNLGFLLQGPFRTTPSRDNVPPSDPWNVQLVREAAALLVTALQELKAKGLLTVAALQSLPIERSKFPEGSMFAPLFDAVRTALASQPLLRCVGGLWAKAADTRLARTQELRELLDSKQLAALLGKPGDVFWLSGDITRDTTATLRQYLLKEIDIAELTPEMVLARLDKKFLEAQPDEWVLKLYEFLEGQPALVRRAGRARIPFVRVENGTHVAAEAGGQPQAFLPSALKSGFPTVRASVCSTKKARVFLGSLGLTEPDAVDDVVRHLLPKYGEDTVTVEDDEYAADIERILNAYNTDLRGQREKLLTALRESTFVMSADLGDDKRYISKPGELYLATERLTKLLQGVTNAMVIDHSYDCLRRAPIRDLLEACGASRSLAPQPVECTLTRDERTEIRRAFHSEGMASEGKVDDHTLRGLPGLLELLPKLDPDARRARAELLWDALKDVEVRRGAYAFAGTYRWHYYQPHEVRIRASFLRTLTDTAWVPDVTGTLHRPSEVVFKTLGWKHDAFLLSQIEFKPPVIEQLAREAGLETGVIELLRQRGITTEAELLAKLGVEPGHENKDESDTRRATGDANRDEPDEVLAQHGATGEPTGPESDSTAGDPAGGSGHGGGQVDDERVHPRGGSRPPGHGGRTTFVSYVGVHPDEDGSDPDGLEHAARMALEAKAIKLIQTREPAWRTTPPNNPGFDLYQAGPDGQQFRWCEVKAMTGCLDDCPVGMTHTEFDHARKRRGAYWLYVVERTGTEAARIVRIQDPAGRAETFTFDHGWLSVAEADSEANG